MPLRRLWVSLLVASVVMGGDGPPIGRAEWREALDRQVDRLIEELGADEVATRERASADLLPLADILLDRLRNEMASTDDAERRARIEALIDEAPGLTRDAEALEQFLQAGPGPTGFDRSAPPWTPAHLASRSVLQMDLADPTRAARIRECFPPTDRPPMLVEALVLRMEDRSPFVAAGACRMLGLIQVREAIPLLRDRLSHPLRWMALAAVDALFSFPDPDLAPLLIDDSALHLASDKDRAVVAARRGTWLVDVCRRRGWGALVGVLLSDARWWTTLRLDAEQARTEPADSPTPTVTELPDEPYAPAADTEPFDAMDGLPPDETYYPGPEPR